MSMIADEHFFHTTSSRNRLYACYVTAIVLLYIFNLLH